MGRKNHLVTKRSLRSADSGPEKRPRRIVQTKQVDDTVGLSRQEEQELNKALYASLNENRRIKSLPNLTGLETVDYSTRVSSNGSSNSSSRSASASLTDKPSTSKPEIATLGKRRSLRGGNPLPKCLFRSDSTGSSENDNLNIDESSQDSVKSSSSSANGSKRKIHAQRKFAQGCSLPGTPTSSPTKASSTPVKLLSRTPKTEDFLTFLCLRGSSVLPPHLDFFNFSREELPLRDDSPKTSSSGRRKQVCEATLDENSSTSSGANEEIVVPVVATPSSVRTSLPSLAGKSGNSQSKRSAARASAGTLETARGIVSLRQGLQRKVSSSSSSSSSSPHLCHPSPSYLIPASGHTTNKSTYLRKPKYYFMPEKSLPSEASGVLPGEFTPPSKMCRMGKHSPLIYRPSPSDMGSPTSSSWSPTSRSSSFSPLACVATGASKRKRRSSSSFFSSDSCQASPLGAFTPVRSPSSLIDSKSSQRRNASGGKRSHSQMASVEVLKSARKNLLGKLTSVANQSKKSFVGNRSKLQSSGKRIRLQRGVKSLSRAARGERRGLRVRRKGNADEKDEEDSNDNSEETEECKTVYRKRKDKTRRHGNQRNSNKPQRRVSERLKVLLRSSHSRRRRLISEDEDDEVGYEQREKVKVKVDSEKASGRNIKSSPPRKHSSHQSSHKRSQNKMRKPFKVRPPERVRTRGYSLMLASKLALKRAKRETAMNRDKEERDMKADEKELKVDESGILPSSSFSTSLNLGSLSLVKKDIDGVKDRIPSSQVQDFKEEGESEGTTQLVKEVKKNLNGRGTPSPKPNLVKRVKSATPTSRPSSASSSSSSSPSASSSSKPLSTSTSQPSQIKHDLIPIYRPMESEFEDPLAYISRIQAEAEPYGMCKIIPPASWKLDSSKINEDIRFTPQVQHIHRLFNRWGPNVQRTAAINHHLLSELASNISPPQIGGVEIDLPQLYALVEEAGGLSKMADKKQWASVADSMNIPKQAMDRTMRLYDIYCRHVLPYATLSMKEQNELEEEVKAIHELQTLEDEAITRGKSMSVSWFSRIARNIQGMWFKDDPSPDLVETEYWRIVEERDRHAAVQCGHINTLAQASAFPTRKDSPYSKHPWNLNLIPNHDQSVLKYLGPVPGTTIPTLHMGMLFSTSCWSNDPHGLPYIQYHHSGADIIWYCISKTQRSKFRGAMMEITSSLISNKPRWLKEDCVMVNPNSLRKRGLKVGRCVHSPREFVVVFPGAHTATVTCGYSVSESVHFATTKWLPFGMDSAMALTRSGEKELFAMSFLLCGLSQDKEIDLTTLTDALPLLSSIVYKELDLRTQLHAAGLRSEKRMLSQESPVAGQGSCSSTSKKKFSVVEEYKTCEICDRICHLSMVYVEQEEQVLCLEHGLRHIQRRKNPKSTRLFVLYNQPELESILKGAKDRLVFLSSPKISDSGSSGGSGSKTRAGTGK